MHPARGGFLFLFQIRFPRPSVAFCDGAGVYSRLVVDSRCNSFLAARWGIAATHLNIPLWNTSKLRAKLFAFVVCLGKVDNAGRSA